MDSIKIDFSDGSFLLLEVAENKKVNIIMCGKKDISSVTMSVTTVGQEQILEIKNFFDRWIENH